MEITSLMTWLIIILDKPLIGGAVKTKDLYVISLFSNLIMFLLVFKYYLLKY